MTFGSMFVHGQKSIHFKVGYVPNYSYTLTQKQISLNKVTYYGSDEILQRLSDNGVANPTVINDTSFLRSESITGNQIANIFPVEVEVLESTNAILVSGTRLFGKSIDNKTHIDSISSPVMTHEQKGTLLPLMESMMNQIEYPDMRMKEGQSFEQVTHMTLPISDVTIEIEINSTYTLKNIKNRVGYFDLSQIYTIKSATKDYDMVIDGFGNGQIHFNEESQFITRFYLDMEMNLRTELEAFSILLESKSITDQRTEVNKESR